MVQNPPQDYVGFLTRMIPCLVRSLLGVHVCIGNFTDAGKELLTGLVGLRQYRSRWGFGRFAVFLAIQNLRRFVSHVRSGLLAVARLRKGRRCKALGYREALGPFKIAPACEATPGGGFLRILSHNRHPFVLD